MYLFRKSRGKLIEIPSTIFYYSTFRNNEVHCTHLKILLTVFQLPVPFRRMRKKWFCREVLIWRYNISLPSAVENGSYFGTMDSMTQLKLWPAIDHSLWFTHRRLVFGRSDILPVWLSRNFLFLEKSMDNSSCWPVKVIKKIVVDPC